MITVITTLIQTLINLFLLTRPPHSAVQHTWLLDSNTASKPRSVTIVTNTADMGSGYSNPIQNTVNVDGDSMHAIDVHGPSLATGAFIFLFIVLAITACMCCFSRFEKLRRIGNDARRRACGLMPPAYAPQQPRASEQRPAAMYPDI